MKDLVTFFYWGRFVDKPSPVLYLILLGAIAQKYQTILRNTMEFPHHIRFDFSIYQK